MTRAAPLARPKASAKRARIDGPRATRASCWSPSSAATAAASSRSAAARQAPVSDVAAGARRKGGVAVVGRERVVEAPRQLADLAGRRDSRGRVMRQQPEHRAPAVAP